MLNQNGHKNISEVAAELRREAAAIRGRVRNASAHSQRIMASEAAAYERAAGMIESAARFAGVDAAIDRVREPL